jgi:signal transduction histidine kinase
MSTALDHAGQGNSMVWQNTPYSLPLAISAVGSFALAVYVLRRRHTPGAVSFSLVLAAIAEWNASYALQISSASFEAKVVFSNLLYIGVVSVPGLWLLFALQYTGRMKRLSARAWLLAIEPVVIVVLTWADSFRIFRTITFDQSGEFAVLAIAYGPVFWVHAAYSYLLLLIGALLLGNVLFQAPFLYRRQAWTVLLGVLAPWLGNVVYISGLSPFPHLDLTPFGFIVMGAAVGFGLYRFRLLDILPIARESVIENLGDGIVVLDPRDIVVDINPAALSMLELPDKQVIGIPLSDAFASLPRLRHALSNDVPNQELAFNEGAEAQIFELRISQLHDHERLAGRLVILRNVTSRRRADAEVVRAQRLRAVGELSLGVSHNLNNILMGVLGPAGLIQHMTDDRRILHEVDVIMRSANMASDLVKRLGRSVHAVEDDTLQAVSVTEAVGGAITAARPKWKDEAEARNAEIEVIADVDSAPQVVATRAGLHDVLLNLLFNAIDALPDGGRIRVEADKVVDEVVLTVSDNGIGMDPDVAARVFEPFFTTKMDIGSGLGLSTAYAQVQQWGGGMNVTSAPDAGTTFELRMPIWRGKAKTADDERGRQVSLRGNSGQSDRANILIVEDDEAVRSFMARVLSEKGYDYRLAGSGLDALDQFSCGSFQAAIIDLGMPGMSGDALSKELRRLDPSLVTILSTGWMLHESDARLDSFDLHIHKPFHVAEIAELLDQANGLYKSRTNT